MSRFLTAGASALAIAAASASPALAQADAPDPSSPTASPWVDVITVVGRALDIDLRVDPAAAPASAPDAAGLIARLPGGDLVDNGALSGQVQYRGVFGPRIAVAVDGQRFASGGPNLMDPPLHYAPAPLIERVELTRGAAPVSAGPGLSARADAVLKSIGFAETDAPAVSADLTGIARSVDDSYAAGGVAGLARRRQRVGILISEERGGTSPPRSAISTGPNTSARSSGSATGRSSPTGSRLAWRRADRRPTSPATRPFPWISGSSTAASCAAA